VSIRVAITLGDPRGIGPEIVERVVADPPPGADLVVVGPDELVGVYADGVGVGSLWGEELADQSLLPSPSSLLPQTAGRLTGLAVEEAVRLVRVGDVDAIVTGPAEKHALHLAGYRYPGHTEWLAALAGDVDVAMMLAAEAFRVVLVTTHVPLSRVTQLLTTQLVVRIGRITLRALRDWFGIAEPRLAVCAVNPHAGERGLFGDEDTSILVPAARQLRAAGPLPADTVFVKASRGEFDAVLAPYHDVGMTAIKMAAFGSAVNVTLGLPFVRTSPDHGTAFDIAGKGIADPGSMRKAVELAIELANRRRGGK
jgi:4-hydroxythreonine-4-phosphate dehydrogenase